MVQPGSFLLSVHAKPGAKSSGFVPPMLPSAPAVEVRIAAPPVEGAANEELVSFVEESLDAAHRRGGWERYFDEAEQPTVESSSGGGKTAKVGKGGKRGGGGSGAASAPAKAAASSSAPLPARVRVGFHSGHTSRSKVLSLELPCASLERAWALILAASAE